MSGRWSRPGWSSYGQGSPTRSGRRGASSSCIATSATRARRRPRRQTITILAWLLLGVALAAGGGAIWLARDRRQAVIRLGVGAVIGGFLLVVALGITRSEVIDTGATSQERDAIGAVWDAFLKDLQTAAWILAACGAVVAAAAASLIRPIDIDLPLRRAYGWIAAEPERSWLRVVRGVALIAVGLVFVLDRDAVIRVVFTARRPVPDLRGRERAALARVPAAPRGGAPRRGDPAPPPPSVDRCARRRDAHHRGRRLRRLRRDQHRGARRRSRATDTRSYAAAHSKTSRCRRRTTRCRCRCRAGTRSSAGHARSPTQLADGIRGLLIDTHYADMLPTAGCAPTWASPGSSGRR